MEKEGKTLMEAISEFAPQRGIRSKIWNKMLDHFYLVMFGLLAFVFILAYFA